VKIIQMIRHIYRKG